MSFFFFPFGVIKKKKKKKVFELPFFAQFFPMCCVCYVATVCFSPVCSFVCITVFYRCLRFAVGCTLLVSRAASPVSCVLLLYFASRPSFGWVQGLVHLFCVSGEVLYYTSRWVDGRTTAAAAAATTSHAVRCLIFFGCLEQDRLGEEAARSISYLATGTEPKLKHIVETVRRDCLLALPALSVLVLWIHNKWCTIRESVSSKDWAVDTQLCKLPRDNATSAARRDGEKRLFARFASAFCPCPLDS